MSNASLFSAGQSGITPKDRVAKDHIGKSNYSGSAGDEVISPGHITQINRITPITPIE